MKAVTTTSSPSNRGPCPEVPFWNLTLRFALELAALVALTVAASGRLATSLVIATPIAAGFLWGAFNVPGDSSRSGEAAVPVPGIVRLAIELAILLGAAWALVATGRPTWGYVLAGLVAFHYAFAIPRTRWLIGV